MPALTLPDRNLLASVMSMLSPDEASRTSTSVPRPSLHPPMSDGANDSPTPSAPVPISEWQNSDAIALRSAMSILQMQREQSHADLRTLDRLKRKAVADSEHFRHALQTGRIKTKTGGGNGGGPLLPLNGADGQDEDEDDDDDEDDSHDDEYGPTKMDVDGAEDKASATFGRIPGPQNVIRCPPINWAKYHIIGEPLDKLHAEQIARPNLGEPQRDPSRSSLADRAAPAVIAAPYRPFIDTIAPMKTRSGSRKDSTR
ncbi:MAG: hypothetical protein M1838_000526 [Thelocarpon superellum]|nr:MAG: hypothetical protein M1838_000526 [Thelocarpon superellum]